MTGFDPTQSQPWTEPSAQAQQPPHAHAGAHEQHGRVRHDDEAPEHEVHSLRALFRQRRMYAQIAYGWKAPTWLRRTLGPFAATYHYWAIQTVTWPSSRAVREFPGWLADTWEVDGPSDLPEAAWDRLRRRGAPPRS